jgi:VCBS repeat-containing protein
MASATEAGGVNNGTAGTIATGNVLTNDTDTAIGGTLSVSAVSFGATVGTVGTALAGNYGSLALNANGTYDYTVANTNATVQAMKVGQTLTEIFNYTAKDSSSGLTASSTLTVTINGANDAPALANSGTVGYIANQAATTIAAGITVADVDNTTFASATITISNYSASEDVLAFTSQGNITGSFNSTNGTLTLTSAGATATLAEWQTVLRSVTYANASSTPTLGARSMNFVLNDGTSNSPALTSMVNVNETPSLLVTTN